MTTATAPRSTWENFTGRALGVMRVDQRANHWTRFFTYDVIRREFGRRHFHWFDVGVVGMVDYERLVDQLSFTFTGVDLSASIIEDGRKYLRHLDDRLLQWNIEDPPATAGLISGGFDLVTARHILNHCHYYEQPLDHIQQLLTEGGLAILTLHLYLRDTEDRLRSNTRWTVPGEVIGNHYNKEKFLRALHARFRIERFIRFDDGVKPNDMLIVRKRHAGEPAGEVPSMEIRRPPLTLRRIAGRLLPAPVKVCLKRLLGMS